MKKIALLVAILFAVTTSSAFATFTAADASGSLTVPSSGTVQAVVKLSKSVKLEYVKDSAGLGYVVGTSHTSGTKTFASSSGDSKIWSKDGLDQSVPSTAPTGTASAAFGTGWTAQ